MFLTKKFKENKDSNFPKTYFKCNDYDHQNTKPFFHNKVSKSMQLNNCSYQKNLMKILI